MIVFKCLPGIRILTTTLNIFDIKIFVKPMFKAEWWDWFLTALRKYTKYSVM